MTAKHTLISVRHNVQVLQSLPVNTGKIARCARRATNLALKRANYGKVKGN